jgi:hypothetical protein
MDMGYDNNRVYTECEERGSAAIIPLRKRRIDPSKRIPATLNGGAICTDAARQSSGSSVA